MGARGRPATVYLDHNATTPLRAEVREHLLDCWQRGWANPSSLHGPGRLARDAVDRARERVGEALGVAEDSVYFTSGGTESNNLALFGTLEAGSVLTTTRVEHSSVHGAAEELQRRGIEVRWIDVDPTGAPRLDSLEAALADGRCTLLSTMAANNEVGALTPLADVGKRVAAHRATGLRWHVDGVQALGRVALELDAWGVDLLSLSAHKVGGPVGVGVLVQRAGGSLRPLFFGGHQEAGLRPGTENPGAISAAALAIELAVAEQPECAARWTKLTQRLWSALSDACPEAELFGPPVNGERLPNTLCVSFPRLDGKLLVTRLDVAGLAVGAGSACASGSVEASHVLLAMGIEEERARSAVRLSLGRETTQHDCDVTVEILRKVCG